MKKDIFFLLPVFTYGAGQSIKRIIMEFGLDMMLKKTLEVYKEVYEEKNIDY